LPAFDQSDMLLNSQFLTSELLGTGLQNNVNQYCSYTRVDTKCHCCAFVSSNKFLKVASN